MKSLSDVEIGIIEAAVHILESSNVSNLDIDISPCKDERVLYTVHVVDPVTTMKYDLHVDSISDAKRYMHWLVESIRGHRDAKKNESITV